MSARRIRCCALFARRIHRATRAPHRANHRSTRPARAHQSRIARCLSHRSPAHENRAFPSPCPRCWHQFFVHDSCAIAARNRHSHSLMCFAAKVQRPAQPANRRYRPSPLPSHHARSVESLHGSYRTQKTPPTQSWRRQRKTCGCQDTLQLNFRD